LADVTKTLNERGERYGDFASHAKITQGIKDVFIASPKWMTLTPSMKEGLDMVAHKIGRILNGDPTYADSWHDIAGYAKLVEDELVDGSWAEAATAPTPPAADPRISLTAKPIALKAETIVAPAPAAVPTLPAPTAPETPAPVAPVAPAAVAPVAPAKLAPASPVTAVRPVTPKAD
jgi:hypothetical protein